MKTPDYYNIKARGMEHWLGSLEACVMSVLWSSPRPLSLQQVYAEVRRRNGWRAKTTVQTTLKRLEGKGLVARSARPYRYCANMTREDWVRERVGAVLDSLVEEYGAQVDAWLEQHEVAV